MRTLLTHANHLYADAKQVRKMQPYPPLQTLIAAALLRSRGEDVAFFDMTFERDFEAALEEFRPDRVVVAEDNFNFLTKMCTLENRRLALEVAAAARSRGIESIVNSSDASDHPGSYRAFDRVIRGELETGLVSGLEISHLDELPMPAWDLIDVERYRNAWEDAHGYFRSEEHTSELQSH